MTNSEIADLIKLYANLYELHDGNPFKVKSYSVAAFKIDKLTIPLIGKNIQELELIDGVGKSLASKIYEINTTDTFLELEELLNKTPEAILQMMKIKGIGPKKIAFIWKELGIENIGELLYACQENRIAQAKGFGLKTQENIIRQIEFMFASSNKFHYAKLETIAADLLEEIKNYFGEVDEGGMISDISFSGDLRRKCEILNQIDLIVAVADTKEFKELIKTADLLTDIIINEDFVEGKIKETIPVKIFISDESDFVKNLFLQTGSQSHLQLLNYPEPSILNPESEELFYQSIGMQYIEPELREGTFEVEKAKENKLPKLIELSDLKGILHNHSTYSDGANSLEEMAVYCKELGYEYLGICDHSKSAFYASGMKAETILKQHAEIDLLNKKLFPFKIFKGIESDILNDGSLDYSNEILSSFDFIVASVHSNLKMTEEKAMLRLIRAIENPYTTILGHPTGRLQLIREGYPIDHKKIIDACAVNGVVIEINAHPYRLDLDWRWVDYAMNKNVKLSINPDAHERAGYHDMYYGVCVARKGGLYKEMCLNSMNLEEIAKYFSNRKPALF
ncbi:MAG: helix-hairpin-helix domain-containing protein [Bacteroidota bacterium]